MRSCAPPDAELSRVKQYLQGEMLRSFGRPISAPGTPPVPCMELQLPVDHFDRMPEHIQQGDTHAGEGDGAKYLGPEGFV